MTPFSISRIHTAQGIFRLSGNWANTDKRVHKENQHDLMITSLEFLGTDGWVALNLATEASQQVISSLTSTFLAHLYSRAS